MIDTLFPPQIEEFLAYTIREDIGEGDHTSLACISPTAVGEARIVAKEEGVIAGIELAGYLFRTLAPSVTFHIQKPDGQKVAPKDVVATISGNARQILRAERLVLNFMQRMSGIATYTHQFVQLLEGTKTRILDTRKTTPGMRFFEKWAVRIGGGSNHRMGLYDMILIKDNHIDFAGGIGPALAHVRNYLIEHQLDIQVEIEVRNLHELEEVLVADGVDIVLLDNFSFEDTRQAVSIINGKFQTESSGNITLKTARQYADCGVDFISSGALTHSVKSLDLSMLATFNKG